MFWIFYDWTFWVFVVPGLLFGIWAQMKVKAAYEKYQKV